MSEFIISVFNIFLSLLRSSDNLIIFVPFACLFISLLFSVVFRLIKGSYK